MDRAVALPSKNQELVERRMRVRVREGCVRTVICARWNRRVARR